MTMSTRSVIIIAVICIALGIGIGVFMRKDDRLKIDVARPYASSTGAGVVLPPQAAAKSYKEETVDYSVDVEYPQLSAMAESGLQDKVNKSIESGVFDQVASFHAQIPSPVGSPEAESLRSMLSADYSVSLLTPSFFSGILAYSNYSAGAAHPNNYLVVLNYDLSKGTAVSLSDFVKQFSPASEWLARLALKVKMELTKQLGDDPDSLSGINEGAAPTLENYRNFTLGPDGLTIHFDPYQVAAYAAGSPAVTVSYDVLISEILKVPAASGSGVEGRWWLR